jgi:DNA primase
MTFTPAFLDELLARSDLVELVSRSVALNRKGGRFWGRCPFHAEKTPSFSVSPDKQLYHCFGCGAGGGAIQFTMQVENLDFPEAVRHLAEAAGLPLPADDANPGEAKRRERLLTLNKAAATFFHGKFPGSAAADYAMRRGLTPAIAKRFGLGYAPDSWDALIFAMTAEGFTKTELLDAGLAKAGKEGSLYDFFRNRVVFPIVDPNKKVLGFAGRALDDKGAKYINTPDTPVFLKRRHLFAMVFARKSKAKQWLLCEGPMDVIALHQAGFDSAVASQGTALTDDHARLIARHVNQAVIVYDTDAAGQAATSRAIATLEKAGLTVRVLRLQGAKDPDEFIRTHGRDAFSALLTGAEGQMEFRLLTAAAKYNLMHDEQRVSFLREGVALLLTLDGPAARAVYSARLADMAGVPTAAVDAEYKLALARKKKQDKTKETRVVMAPVLSAQPGERTLRYQDVRSARAEEGLLSLLLNDPALAEPTRLALSSGDFSSDFLGRAYDDVCASVAEGRVFTLAAAEYSPAEMSKLTELAARPVAPGQSEEAARDCIRVIIERKNLRNTADPLESRLKMRNIGNNTEA